MAKNILRSDNGFTLIEALIAIMIMTIGVMGVMAMQTTAIRGNYKASTMTRACSAASGKLEELRSKTFDSVVTTVNWSDPATGYTMNWTVAQVSGVADAKLITLTVNRPNNLSPVTYEYIKYRE